MQAREDPHPTAEAVLSADLEKQRLRKEAGARRAALARAVPDFAARIAAFADKIPARPGAVVSAYWAMRDEADPRPLMLALAAKGHPLALPRIAERGAPLVFHRWRESDTMDKGGFGLTEPLKSAEMLTPSVLLVPLLAFDGEGYRLGYGGGYYDRTLARLRAMGKILAVGVAYAGQRVERLPHLGYDEKLDAVVTEDGFKRFKPGLA